jgi:hypothetical protein
MEARRGDQGAQAAEEGVDGHVRERSASAPGGLEVDANATVLESLNRVVGEGRAEQVATDPLESPAVAAVDRRGGVEVHAVGTDRVRRRLGVGCDGGEVRASQRVQDTGRERGVEVEVEVFAGCEDRLHSTEDGGHPRGGRRRRGSEAQLVTTLLEGAVGHEEVEVHVEAKVAAEPLHDRDNAAVERRDGGESVLTLDRASDVLKDRSTETPRDHIYVGDGRRHESKLDLDWLEERLEGKCDKRLIHFGGCGTLATHGLRINRFLRNTGALAVCGYKTDTDWLEAAAFEILLLAELQRCAWDGRGMAGVKRRIRKNAAGLARALHFRMVTR